MNWISIMLDSLKRFHLSTLSVLTGGTLGVLLGILSCTSTDSGDADSTVKAFGVFQVSLVAPTEISAGFSQVTGKLYDGDNPTPVNWVVKAQSGSCTLYTPSIPLCVPACGSSAICVDNNICQAYPKEISAGVITVTGLKTKAGANGFSMSPLNRYYQVPAGTILAYPPFELGGVVTLSASGDSSAAPFALSGAGIEPLKVLQDTLVLVDGLPIHLEWTAGKSATTRITLDVDISHHGGTQGKISCEAEDNGSLEIPATLVTQLKALGMAGYPKMDIRRKAETTSADSHVKLVMESGLTLPLAIPGLVSCGDDSDCTDGQTCQRNLTCK